MQICTLCIDYGYFIRSVCHDNHGLRRGLLCFMVWPAPVTHLG